MKSKIFSSDYVKAASKGQMWIPAFFTLAFLIAFPVTELMMLGNWFGNEYYTLDVIEGLYTDLWTDGFMAVGFLVITCGGVVNGINSFWYLYSARKTDFYHSLPVKRSKIFWNRTYMGILYYLIPYAVMEFLAVCFGALRGFFSLEIVGNAILMLVMHLILYLLMYFSTVLVICVTGNILMGSLCLGGLFLYGPVLGVLIKYYRGMFFNTAYNNANYGLLKFLCEYASPFVLGRTFLEQYGDGDYLESLLILLAATAVMGVLAYIAYAKRPSESAGKPMLYRWLKIAVKTAVVVPFGLGIGWIFYILSTNDSRTIWWILGMVLGTVISHGMIEVIFQMDFRKFLSDKYQLLIAGLLVVICASNYKMDLLHFDAYLPEREELAAVSFDFNNMGMGMYDSVAAVEKDDEGYYHSVSLWDNENTAFTGADGVGQKTWNVLNSIVCRQEALCKGRNGRLLNYFGTWYSSGSDVLPVKYVLKSGREIYRLYLLENQDLYELLDSLYEEGTLKEKKYSFMEIEEQYLEIINGDFMNGESYVLFQDKTEKYKELLDALREDINEASAEELLAQPCVRLSLYYETPFKEEDMANTRVLSKVRNPFEYEPYEAWVMVYPTFKRTIAILEETGYPITMDDVPIDNVSIRYYDGENDTDFLMTDPILYDSKEEIAALKKAMVPSALECGWINYDAALDVNFKKSGNYEYEIYAILLKDKVPDFVEKRKEELKNGSKGTEASKEELLQEDMMSDDLFDTGE